jgi:hypothetical protein
MRLIHNVSYFLDRSGLSGKVSEEELKNTALRLRTAVAMQSLKVGDLFGSSSDLWGFSVETEPSEILVDVSAYDVATENRWDTSIMLVDRGWFKGTRHNRLQAMKDVEWAVHKALCETMGGRDLIWFLGNGPVSRQKGQPTP